MNPSASPVPPPLPIIDLPVGRPTRSQIDSLLVGAVVLLALGDLVLSTAHLDAGHTVANPFMLWVLGWGGRLAFQVVKLVPILCGLVILLWRGGLRRMRPFVGVAAVLYAILLALQFATGAYAL